ncbi:MAG: ABC transporter permease [Lachnospiraceae bacterium]
MKRKLFGFTLKKILYQLPAVFFLSLLLIALLGTAAVCAQKILYAGQPLVRASVAIVTPDPDDMYFKFAINMLENMESTAESLEFHLCNTEKEGYRLLDQGRIIALIVFPENAINSILTGENIPIQVVFDSRNELSASVLAELTAAGTRLLSSAQAGTYTTSRLYYTYETEQELNEAYNDVDLLNFSYCLYRQELFHRTPISFGGTENTIIYYASSALLLFLLLFGSAFLQTLSSGSVAFCDKLKCYGITPFSHLSIRFFGYFLCLFAGGNLFLFLGGQILKHLQKGAKEDSVLQMLSFEYNSVTFLCLFVFALFLATYFFFIQAICHEKNAAVLLFFLLSSGLMLISGSIIPLAFFPEIIRSVAPVLPTYHFQLLLSGLLEGKILTMADLGLHALSLVNLMGYSIAFFFITIICMNHQQRKVTNS